MVIIKCYPIFGFSRTFLACVASEEFMNCQPFLSSTRLLCMSIMTSHTSFSFWKSVHIVIFLTHINYLSDLIQMQFSFLLFFCVEYTYIGGWLFINSFQDMCVTFSSFFFPLKCQTKWNIALTWFFWTFVFDR